MTYFLNFSPSIRSIYYSKDFFIDYHLYGRDPPSLLFGVLLFIYSPTLYLCVVYFDQCLGAVYSKGWSKDAFQHPLKKAEKGRKSKKFTAKFNKKWIFWVGTKTFSVVKTFIGHDAIINTGCTYKVISYRAGAGIWTQVRWVQTTALPFELSSMDLKTCFSHWKCVCSGNKTLNQHSGANSKTNFLLNVAANFFLLLPFFSFFAQTGKA